MTPLRRLVLFAACAAAAGNNTTRVNKETKPADQTLVETDGLNQTCAVNETKPAVADQTFVQNATTGENQTHTVDVTTSTDGTYANITPNMTLVNFENKSRKARNSVFGTTPNYSGTHWGSRYLVGIIDITDKDFKFLLTQRRGPYKLLDLTDVAVREAICRLFDRYPRVGHQYLRELYCARPGQWDPAPLFD